MNEAARNAAGDEAIARAIEDVDFALYGLIVDTSNLCVKARGNELSQYGISPIEARVLFVLQSLGSPSTPAQISRRVFREHNSVSALINRMHGKGLVAKVRDTRRRNLWRVSLTEKGRGVVLDALQIDSVRKIFSHLSPEDRRTLEALLTKVRNDALAQLARDTLASLPWVAMHHISLD